MYRISKGQELEFKLMEKSLEIIGLQLFDAKCYKFDQFNYLSAENVANFESTKLTSLASNEINLNCFKQN